MFAAAERATRAATLIDLEALVNASGQGTALSPSEAGTIAAGFTKAPSADESLPALLRILSGYEDSELDRAAVSVLEAALAAPRIPFWVPDVIARIVARSGRRDWGSSIWQRHLENGTLRDLWPSVAGDLHLSGIPPARVRIEGALRAGPD